VVMSILIAFVPLLVIILIVFAIAGSRLEAKEGGEEMIKNVYLYLVLFATLMMTIGGSVGAFMALADIIAPTPYYQSFEEFRQRDFTKPYPELETVETETPSEEELQIRYEALVTSHTKNQVARATNSLIKSLGWIIVPFPIFIYFQRRLMRKEG
jgi:hypothetical protein